MEDSEIITEEKAYILGVLCGDGFLTTNYRFGLEVCDLDFAEEFARCLNEVYNLNPKIKEKIRNKTNFGKAKKQYSVVISSKNVWLDLIKYSDFKTKSWIIPKIIKNTDINILSNFIKGIFDSEGTIRFRRNGYCYLQVCSGNDNSLLDLKNILENKFGINMKIKYNNNGVIILYTAKYKYIKLFADCIGFKIKRKQTILEIGLNSYKRVSLRSYDQDFKEMALKLLENDYGVREIGRIMDFPYTNIYDFKKQKEKKLE